MTLKKSMLQLPECRTREAVVATKPASIASANQSWFLVFYQAPDEASEFFLASNAFFFFFLRKTVPEIKNTKAGGGSEGEGLRGRG